MDNKILTEENSKKDIEIARLTMNLDRQSKEMAERTHHVSALKEEYARLYSKLDALQKQH